MVSQPTSRANPTSLSSLKGKEEDVSKKIFLYIYMAPLRPKTQKSFSSTNNYNLLRAQYWGRCCLYYTQLTLVT